MRGLFQAEVGGVFEGPAAPSVDAADESDAAFVLDSDVFDVLDDFTGDDFAGVVSDADDDNEDDPVLASESVGHVAARSLLPSPSMRREGNVKFLMGQQIRSSGNSICKKILKWETGICRSKFCNYRRVARRKRNANSFRICGKKNK